ncbi:FAD:protein FMN transferase [Jatrophihabitans telluris]|uniref:FAD:protein FMN transferase n=1 Tax=Jatrophihabitans telluris TaxID=2038343 RepID=A0ABY4QXK4_9ACTN|nr:FAD:protein FMN transferase [Jatrophihabitans telluris]UQX88238.1 FAD:protein FMN transferase [Jatrophihabitans telluris]
MGIRHVEAVMGTMFSIEIRDARLTGSAAERVLEPLLARLHAIDADYSPFRPDSLVSRVNRGELSERDLPAEAKTVLRECELWRELSGGAFDVRATGRLDPCGYVKGWAIAEASRLLAEAGSTWHCVNGGGDVQAVAPADVRPWRVAIADPRDRGRTVATLTGHTLAVATSGSAERGEHIADPRTGRPATGDLLSLSVYGRSIIDCDVLATAGYAMGADVCGWFTQRPHLTAYAVRASGTSWLGRPAA